MVNMVVGLDLGQSHDYTALAVVEKVSVAPVHLHCRHLERYPLGTRYPAIVEAVAEIMRSPQLRGAPLVVDATGVGRPVVDMFVAAGLKPISVLVTGGDAVSHEKGYWKVPKRDLVGAVQAPLQDKRLQFAASLALAQTLVGEMLNFRVKISDAAHDSYGAWRENENDDLIFAVMLAAWWAHRPAPKAARSYDGFTGDED